MAMPTSKSIPRWSGRPPPTAAGNKGASRLHSRLQGRRSNGKASQWTQAALTPEQLLGRLHDVIYPPVQQAASLVAHLEAEWSEGEIAKRIVRYMYKAASDTELLTMPWDQCCKELVQRMMHGYSAACSNKDWFFSIDLPPALLSAAWEILQASGQAAATSPEEIQEVIVLEYEDKLDRILLDRAMWGVTCDVFSNEKVQSKVFQAISRAYWPALDTVLENGLLEEEILRGDLPPHKQLQRVEAFTRQWIDDSVCRAWVSVEQAESMLTEDVVEDLFRGLIMPFGGDDPFSCMPAALTGNIGRPPPDWVFLTRVVQELFSSWKNGTPGGGSSKKRKRAGGGGWEAKAAKGPEVSEDAWGEEEADANPFAVAAEEEALAPEPRVGHPLCTSEDDCIGVPEDCLVRHLLNGQPGDVYCESCWESFVAKNPILEGERLDDTAVLDE